MDITQNTEIDLIFEKQKTFFDAQHTKSYSFRIQQLKQLKRLIKENESSIYEALYLDLKKNKDEAFFTEISILKSEISYHIKNLKKWMRPQSVSTPVTLWPSKSYIQNEPLGVSLIISPWNYPFQLALAPLIGSISSGCCAIIKPSEKSNNTSDLIANLISKYFEASYISVVLGHADTAQFLLSKPFDFIFFTGNPNIGKIVMQAAAQNLTPCVLELGGKSPCIVDKEANIEIAAKRIVWGKWMNNGQTCIAPDYIFIHEDIKEIFTQNLIKYIKIFYSDKPENSNFYGRIIDDQAFARLSELVKTSNLLFGGNSDASQKFMEPTVISSNINDKIMGQEIFGPILPLISFSKIEDCTKYINQNPKPLAMYYFGNESIGKELSMTCSSGGFCINDVLLQVANHNLPFGGVGNSGLGKYHGKESFNVFSNSKAVMISPTFIDIPMKYIPYKGIEFIKKWIIK